MSSTSRIHGSQNSATFSVRKPSHKLGRACLKRRIPYRNLKTENVYLFWIDSVAIGSARLRRDHFALFFDMGAVGGAELQR
jgi:hypothetical protein